MLTPEAGDLDLAVRAAWLYYEDGLTQAQVDRSQPGVVAHGRQGGHVQGCPYPCPSAPDVALTA